MSDEINQATQNSQPANTGAQPTFVIQNPVAANNGVSIVSFVTGVISIFFLSLLFSPIALLTGIIGIYKKQYPFSIIGIICAIIGVWTSPTFWLLFAGLGIGSGAISLQ